MDAFWDQVNQDGECWEWVGVLTPTGYGRFGRHMAHRLAYELTYGPVSPTWDVHHTCENPACVRPSHLDALERSEHRQKHLPNRPGKPMTQAEFAHLSSEARTLEKMLDKECSGFLLDN